MDIYKKAVRKDLTFQTSVGVVTVNQLFKLNMSQLENAIRTLKAKIKALGEVGELDFLITAKKKSVSEDELRFEILKDVYVTLKEESEKKIKAAENKRQREKILEIIAEKQEESLKNKSISDLMKDLEATEVEEYAD